MSIRKRVWTSEGRERTAWVVDYKDQHGKRRLKTFRTQKAAKTWWEGQAGYEVHHGTHTPDSASVTVRDAGKAWIERIELEGRQRSTVRQYRQHVELHINPRLGGERLSRLSRPRVEALRDELLRDLSRPMARKVLTSLKSLLSDAQRRGWLAQNVAQGVRIKTEWRDKERLEYGTDIPTREEIQAILAAATSRWRPLIVTAIFTGLRASELRGLTWEHVDFESRLIRVRQRADRFNQIDRAKSRAGERDVPMTPMVLNTLKEWKLACPRPIIGRDEDDKPIREAPKDAHLVFPNGDGNVESLSNMDRRGFGAVQIAAGIVRGTGREDDDGNPVMTRKYGWHALRHFYASWCINRKRDGGLELPPKTVQERLGHSGITMTLDVYGHLFPESGDDFAEMEAAEAALVSAPERGA